MVGCFSSDTLIPEFANILEAFQETVFYTSVSALVAFAMKFYAVGHTETTKFHLQ
jgi:hypothetical protein